MGSKERQARQRDERRQLILKAASDIIAEEGVDSLSIRKIAARIEFSAAIIYHYFKNKDSILETLLTEKYQGMVETLRSAPSRHQEPDVRFREYLDKYVGWALDNSEEYKTFMLSDAPGILQHTSVLQPGAIDSRPAIRLLTRTIKEMRNTKTSDQDSDELTAQVVWAATFGIILRIIIEDLPKDQRDRFLQHFADFVIGGISALGNSDARDST